MPNNVSYSVHINLGGSSSRKHSYYDLPDVGSIVLQLLTKNGVSKFLLTSLNENGMRVFILSPFFVISNISAEPFNYWSFCVSSKDKHSVSVDNAKAEVHVVPCNSEASSRFVLSKIVTHFADFWADCNFGRSQQH